MKKTLCFLVLLFLSGDLFGQHKHDSNKYRRCPVFDQRVVNTFAVRRFCFKAGHCISKFTKKVVSLVKKKQKQSGTWTPPVTASAPDTYHSIKRIVKDVHYLYGDHFDKDAVQKYIDTGLLAALELPTQDELIDAAKVVGVKQGSITPREQEKLNETSKEDEEFFKSGIYSVSQNEKTGSDEVVKDISGGEVLKEDEGEKLLDVKLPDGKIKHLKIKHWAAIVYYHFDKPVKVTARSGRVYEVNEVTLRDQVLFINEFPKN